MSRTKMSKNKVLFLCYSVLIILTSMIKNILFASFLVTFSTSNFNAHFHNGCVVKLSAEYNINSLQSLHCPDVRSKGSYESLIQPFLNKWIIRKTRTPIPDEARKTRTPIPDEAGHSEKPN